MGLYYEEIDPENEDSQKQKNESPPFSSNDPDNWAPGQFQQPQSPVPPSKRPDGMAIASFVCGIISVLCCSCYLLAGLLAISGIIFAIISRRTTGKFHGLCLAGLILSIIGLLLFILIVVVSILLSSGAFDAFLRPIWNDVLEEMARQGMDTSGWDYDSIFH